jgi:hypothetical protein
MRAETGDCLHAQFPLFCSILTEVGIFQQILVPLPNIVFHENLLEVMSCFMHIIVGRNEYNQAP